jgi:hypothetical protein
MILLILILLDNDIAENPDPFSDEISIFHVNARSVRKKLDYIESVGEYTREQNIPIETLCDM